jgi:hypothetical protein
VCDEDHLEWAINTGLQNKNLSAVDTSKLRELIFIDDERENDDGIKSQTETTITEIEMGLLKTEKEMLLARYDHLLSLIQYAMDFVDCKIEDLQ